jgi:hypothetical protein
VCVFITCVANTIEVQILCNIYRFTEYGIQQDLWYRYEDEEGYVYGSSSSSGACPGETGAESSLRGYILEDIKMDAIQIGETQIWRVFPTVHHSQHPRAVCYPSRVRTFGRHCDESGNDG